MHGVEGVIKIEHDPLRHPAIGGAKDIDERPPHARQRTQIGQILLLDPVQVAGFILVVNFVTLR